MAFAETTATSGIVNERYQAPSFDMRRFTRAPMRLEGTFFFNAPQETVFERVTDPNMIAKWFSSLITNGYVDHTRSEKPGDWGAGTKRYCTLTDGGVLDETILHWAAPYICVYTVKNKSMPIKSHAAVMLVEPLGAGRSVFTWRQYFDLTGVVKRLIFPGMMRSMMTKGVNTLARELGGEGGAMRKAG